tara:strand:+ start:2486 stop:2695 length:210 start_codon:yes stop_codon:yes gene_type:complete
MDKIKFLKLLNKALVGKKLTENSKLNLDSLNMLQIVEFNNKYFKNSKLNEKKIFESKSVKEILQIYRIK